MATLGEAAFGKDAAGVRRLLAGGAQPNDPAQFMQGYQPLNCAAFGGDLACMQELIAAGADLEATDEDGYTALITTVQ